MPRPSTLLDELHLIRRWTEEEGRIAVEALRVSGLSVEEFATRHKLHPVRVARWAARLAPKRVTTALMPVDVVPARTAAVVEVVASGRILRVPTDLDGAVLARLILVVETA